ncbi:MAG: hypothetical protein Q8R12_01570 [bacterium]|nr:hypothetical protein [bacterium]
MEKKEESITALSERPPMQDNYFEEARRNVETIETRVPDEND